MLEKFDNKKNPFKVPENYFQDFSTSIMDKLPEKENKTAKITPLWKKVMPWAAVAAIFCGVIFSTGIFKQDITENGSLTENGLASTLEDDYYLFLEEEVTNSMYKEMFYNN